MEKILSLDQIKADMILLGIARDNVSLLLRTCFNDDSFTEDRDSFFKAAALASSNPLYTMPYGPTWWHFPLRVYYLLNEDEKVLWAFRIGVDL